MSGLPISMSNSAVEKLPLTLLIAAPRGFCAGVDRAIEIVERALERYGAPVYVRHEIVHNRHVVDRLKGLGAVFVEELSECPTRPRAATPSACRSTRRTACTARPATSRTRRRTSSG